MYPVQNEEVAARLNDVTKEYKSGDTTITALSKASLEVKKGRLMLILGPSGSGKTTLLSLIGCVIYPSSGEVYIKGKSITKMKSKELALLRLKNIGFVFQNFNLLAPLTAEQNVMLPLKLIGKSNADARKKTEEALKLVNMTHRKDNLPKMLSGGEKQRIAVARALVTDASILLCDEPTASLDSKSAGVVMKELKDLSRSGKAVIVVTHDERLKEYADEVIQIEDGVIQN